MEGFVSRRGQKNRLREQRDQFENALREKQERLLELRDECLQLRHQLETYQSMEKQIAGALVEAKAQANRILEAAREQAQQELEEARSQAQQEMCAVRLEIDQVKQRAREQAGLLEELIGKARAIAGEGAAQAQPVLRAMTLLGREEDKTA
jgi:dsDNA-specific endonuclease/ATPase MutS2